MDFEELLERANNLEKDDCKVDTEALNYAGTLPQSSQKSYLTGLIVNAEVGSPAQRPGSPKQEDETVLKGVNLSENRGLFGMRREEEPQDWVPDVHLKAFRDICGAAHTCGIKEINLAFTGMGPNAVRALSSRRLFTELLEVVTLSSTGLPQITADEIAAEVAAAEERKTVLKSSPPWPRRGVKNGAGFFTLEICNTPVSTHAIYRCLRCAERPFLQIACGCRKTTSST